MSEAEKVIRIRIDASGAQAGARQVNSAISSITRQSAGLRGANDNAAGSMDRLTRSMAGAGAQGRAMGGILGSIRGAATSAIPAVSGLVGSIAAMGPQAAVVAAVGAAFIFMGSKAIQAAAQVESWKARLTAVTGSAKLADSAYRALVAFAAKTPFTLDQSVEGFTKLRALGLSTSEAIMTSYGNTASAVGGTMTQMVEAVADAVTGEFERLKSFGIKTRQEGNKVAFTFQGVTTTVEKNAKAIEGYLISIGQTKFASAMALQMMTINGAFANLEDTIFQMFARIGGGELGTAVKTIVQDITSAVSAITPVLGGIGDVVGSIIGAIWEVGKAVLSVFGIQFGLIGDAGSAAQTLGDVLSGIASVITFLGRVIGDTFGLLVGSINGAILGIKGFLGLNGQVEAGVASWSQIFEASWNRITQGWDAMSAKASEWVGGLAESTKSTLGSWASSLGSFFEGPVNTIKDQFSGLTGFFDDLFGDLDFNAEGIVIGAARVVDLVIGTFRGGWNVIQVLWAQLPGVIWASLSPGLQNLVSGVADFFSWLGNGVAQVYNAVAGFGSWLAGQIGSIFNSILAFINRWINKAIDALNVLIDKANAVVPDFLGTVEKVGNVTIGQITAPAGAAAQAKGIGAQIGAAFKAGFGSEAEGVARSIIGDARGISRGSDTGNMTFDALGGDKGANAGGSKSGAGAGGADKAAATKKALDEFWQTLKDQAATAALLPLEAENLSKQLELQKILGRDLNALDVIGVNLALQKVRTNQFLTDAKQASIEACQSAFNRDPLSACKRDPSAVVRIG